MNVDAAISAVMNGKTLVSDNGCATTSFSKSRDFNNQLNEQRIELVGVQKRQSDKIGSEAVRSAISAIIGPMYR
jgi:hypothetical protein